MRRLILMSLLICAAALLPGKAFAQLPEGVAAKMPHDVPYGPSITLAKAQQAVAAAEAEAKKHDWKMAIAVVDPNGDLVYFVKMDSTQIASTLISQGKARTATRFRRPTMDLFKAMESGHNYVHTLDPTLVASGGGIPLVEGGKIIGAIGCSGGTGAQDNYTCQAGANVIK